MKTGTKEQLFTKLLLKWNHECNKRQMPWKHEKDPYKIWLSEIILQQTRVEQGLEYYKRFVRTFPSVKKLAAATDDEVFKLWEGLGYYSRCKNLLATARYIAFELNGRFPEEYDTILQLKGVGPYTAAAIASFAYDLPYAVVDGNVNRVLARFFGDKTPIDSTAGKKLFSTMANRLLPARSAAIFNQAIMDFGATVCKPQLPLCVECILRKQCTAFTKQQVATLPVKEKKLVRTHRWFYYIVARHNNSMLIRKRTEKDIWQNLHEFLLIELAGPASRSELVNHDLVQQFQLKGFHLDAMSAPHKQQLTHQTIHAVFLPMDGPAQPAVQGMEWVQLSAIEKLAFPRIINEYLLSEARTTRAVGK